MNKLLDLHIAPLSNDNPLVNTFKSALVADLQERYTGKLLQFLTKATILDPPFKGLRFLSPEEHSKVVTDLKSDADLICDNDVFRSGPKDELEEPPKKKGKPMSILQDMSTIKTVSTTITTGSVIPCHTSYYICSM